MTRQDKTRQKPLRQRNNRGKFCGFVVNGADESVEIDMICRVRVRISPYPNPNFDPNP